MKIILCAMVLSLVSLAGAASMNTSRGPNSVGDGDLTYICKNPANPTISYVANISDGIIKVYYSTPDLADGPPTLIMPAVENLEVNIKTTDVPSKKGKKFHTSYTFSKISEDKSIGDNGKLPILEIEMERDSNAKYVAYADAKFMNVKPTDENDAEENVTCKRNIK